MRLLFCDDDPDTLEFFRELLEQGGCSVQAAGTGYAAIQALGVETFDGVIADYRMANGDGGMISHFCHERSIPCVIITGAVPASVKPYLAQSTKIVGKVEFSGLLTEAADASAANAGIVGLLASLMGRAA